MSYSHFNARERVSLFYLNQMNLSLREIARRLNRSHTTISRELNRNKRVVGCYCDQAAQDFAAKRKIKPRHQRRYANLKLRSYVITKLKLGWSPEIISNRLNKDYPYSIKKMVISAESIYQWIYKDVEQGGDLFNYLVRAHKKRKKQRRYNHLRSHIKNRVDISERPLIVEQRLRYGDWEGDTMVGHRHKGRLVTHVERKSRYLLACKINDGKASSFNKASLTLFQPLPKKCLKTLTLDNGSENTNFKQLEKALSINVYFAKPYASWERGTNENTNGLIRRYFPKGTDFLQLPSKELEKVVNLLNHRPRKCLKYKTPFEVFNSITGGALRT
jgi:IS30 family transposase